MEDVDDAVEGGDVEVAMGRVVCVEDAEELRPELEV